MACANVSTENTLKNEYEITSGITFKDEQYRVIEKIGRGGQSNVFLIKDKFDGKL
jgi:hypothetical protein